MKYPEDQCIGCRSRARPHDLTPMYSLEADGSFGITGHWFCSERCYKREVRKYLDKEHDFDSEPDPEQALQAAKLARFRATTNIFKDVYFAFNDSAATKIEQQGLKDYVYAWDDAKKQAIRGAENEIKKRLLAEQVYEIDQKQAQIDKMVEESEEQDREFERKMQQMDDEMKEEDRELKEYLQSLEPKPIPEHTRFEHTHIIGPSRSGKTTLLQQIFLDDLSKKHAYVIIDPKGLLIERISNLKAFEREGWTRLVIIDPNDPPPALGMFSLPKDVRPSYLNQLIETFSYIFSSADAPLTQRQSIPFSYVVRLVFSMQGDIETLMDILEDTTGKFAPHMEKLTDVGARRFFQKDFYDKEFSATRQQIRTRLYEIISKPELMAMLGARENKLSLTECLEQGKIVLVNTAMGLLNPKGSALFGRYIIAQTLAAAFSRKVKTPAFLMIDEFQDFADEYQTPRMLRLAGEYNLGIILAHQTMHCAEFNQPIQTAISTNTSIKYCASPEGVDVSYMARDLNCDAAFLKRIQKTPTHAQFACHVRGMGLERPFIVSVELGNIQKQPQNDEPSTEEVVAWAKDQLRETPKASEQTGAPAASPMSSSTARVVTPAETHNPQEARDPSEPSKWTPPD
jgi:hypothetical protein